MDKWKHDHLLVHLDIAIKFIQTHVWNHFFVVATGVYSVILVSVRIVVFSYLVSKSVSLNY